MFSPDIYQVSGRTQTTCLVLVKHYFMKGVIIVASSNAIKIKQLEQERDLKLAELRQAYDLKLREFELEKNKLAETISNNLRNYKINISKNTIERLANDQLNDRENRKIVETVRHNLEVELETKRSNMSNEAIRTVENEIRKLDAILSGSKMVGKDAAALAISGTYNQAMLAALGLPTIPGEARNGILNFLHSTPEFNEEKTYHGVGAREITPVDPQKGIIKYTNKDGVITSGILKGKRLSDLRGDTSSSRSNNHRGSSNYTRRKDDINEIPEDLTYSGPNERRNNNETNVNQAQSIASSGSGTTGYQRPDQTKTPSVGESTGKETGSKIYYSPGSQVGPGWFS